MNEQQYLLWLCTLTKQGGTPTPETLQDALQAYLAKHGVQSNLMLIHPDWRGLQVDGVEVEVSPLVHKGEVMLGYRESVKLSRQEASRSWTCVKCGLTGGMYGGVCYPVHWSAESGETTHVPFCPIMVLEAVS